MATNEAPDTPPPDSAVPAAQADLASAGLVVPRPRKLSEVMDHLIAEFHTRPVTLREVIIVLQGRAYDLLMLLLALPFLLPIPLPGLSTVLGLVIAFIALRMTLGQKPWLPVRLLDRELPPKFFPTLLGGARKILRFLEVMLKPRQLWMTGSPLLIRLHASMILIAALLLLLPLPPGTNFTPGLCIVIMAGGLLERDGYFIVAGYFAAVLNAAFFIFIALYGQKAMQAIWSWFAS